MKLYLGPEQRFDVFTGTRLLLLMKSVRCFDLIFEGGGFCEIYWAFKSPAMTILPCVT